MEIEWLILADAAQVVGNKLYLMGGGWDVLTVDTGFPLQHRCAVTVAVRVPWNETNQKHSLEIVIADDDGKQLGTIRGQFEVGRPPGIPLGQDQRVQIAAEMMLKIEKAGGYVVVAHLDGHEERRVPFNVVLGPVLAIKRQQGGGAE